MGTREEYDYEQQKWVPYVSDPDKWYQHLLDIRDGLTLLYEHELFPAVNFKIKGINFCCFHTGKVIITGIRRPSQIDGVVYPTLVELELYVRTSM